MSGWESELACPAECRFECGPRTTWIMSIRILLMERDLATAASQQQALRRRGYTVTLVLRDDDGLALAQRDTFDLVLVDQAALVTDSGDWISRLQTVKSRLPILLMTGPEGNGSHLGSINHHEVPRIKKPFTTTELCQRIDTLLSQVPIPTARSMPVTAPEGEPAALIGKSQVMQALRQDIVRIAGTQVPVLIQGAPGTGKSLVAQLLHQRSNRAHLPLVSILCAALPPELSELELFGCERGALPGITARKLGRLEEATGGTVLLDSIGDLTLSGQARLSRLLLTHCLQRMGGDSSIPVDLRILATTDRNLELDVVAHRFREDLFLRMALVTLVIPSLQERPDDIPELVNHLLLQLAPELGVEAPKIHAEAVTFLQSQRWPGNVHELEGVVRHALSLAQNSPVTLEHVLKVCLFPRS